MHTRPAYVALDPGAPYVAKLFLFILRLHMFFLHKVRSTVAVMHMRTIDSCIIRVLASLFARVFFACFLGY